MTKAQQQALTAARVEFLADSAQAAARAELISQHDRLLQLASTAAPPGLSPADLQPGDLLLLQLAAAVAAAECYRHLCRDELGDAKS